MCQSLAGVAGKMGDGRRRRRLPRWRSGFAEPSWRRPGGRWSPPRRRSRRSQSQSHSHRRRRVSGRKTPRTRRPNRFRGDAARRARDRRPDPRQPPPITSPDHARAFSAAAAAAKRALAGARRAEVAALANVGAALLRGAATSGLASGAWRRPKKPEDAPWGPTSPEDRGRRRRPEGPSPAIASPRAWRGEEALASCAGTRRDRRTPRWRSGFCWSSPTRTTTAGGERRARARLARRARAAVKALTANQREFPNTCTPCSETGRHRERGEADTRVGTTGSGSDAAAADATW